MRRCLIAGTALVMTTFTAVSSWAQGAPASMPLPESQAGAGSIAAIPSALISEALSVAIVASVGRRSEIPSWEARDVKYTIPGSSVSITMLGREVAIVITITPYKTKDGGLLLVAQGQVWYKDGEAGLRYRTTVDTLLVNFGERVLFYPFGVQPDGGTPLRVELVLDRYHPEDNDASTKPARAEGVPAKDKARP